MKYFLSLLVMLFTLNIQAQVNEKSASLSLGDQNAYIMDHENADKKTVEKIVENAFKQYGKVKRNRKAKEWSCQSCEISMISTQPITVYYKVEEKKDMIRTYTFFDDGSKFLSSENDSKASEAIEKLNINIYYDVLRSVISEQLKNEEKNLKNFNKDLSKLSDKNEDLHKDIEKYRQKIKEAEKDIEENLLQQEEKKMQIAKQESLVSKVKDNLNNVGNK